MDSATPPAPATYRSTPALRLRRNAPIRSSAALSSFLARLHLLPEAYLYGWVDILLIQRTRPTFVFGHMYPTGQWFFFPAVFLLKTTLTLCSFFSSSPSPASADHAANSSSSPSPAALFFAVAISSINIGVRYLLPIYPFCIVLAAAAAASLFTRAVPARIAVASLLLFTVFSSLQLLPDYLAYSNELSGGPAKTYRFVTDANDDWGQGLSGPTPTSTSTQTRTAGSSTGNPSVDPAYYGIHCNRRISGLPHLRRRPRDPSLPPSPEPSSSAPPKPTASYGVPTTSTPISLFHDRTPTPPSATSSSSIAEPSNVPLLAAETNAGRHRSSTSGRLPEALALAQTAAQHAPDAADVNFVLGQTLLASGRIPEGRQAMAEALRLARANHPDYQTYLIRQIEHPQGHP